MSGARADDGTEDLPLFLQPEPRRLVERPARRPGGAGTGARAGHVPGEAGLWVFVLGDLALFGLFFVGYLVFRRAERDVFATSGALLAQDLGTANTLILLTSSLCVVFAVREFRLGRAVRAGRLLGATLVFAAAFVTIKLGEYRELVAEGHAPTDDAFLTFYFVLTGIHLLHVLIGMVLVLVLALRFARRRGGTAPTIGGVEGTAVYWHMVDLLWIGLFALLYLVPAL